MVDDQQGPAGVFGGVLALLLDEEDVHAVVLVADTIGVVVGLQTQAGKAGYIEVHGIPSGMHHAVLIARWQHDIVGEQFFDWLET